MIDLDNMRALGQLILETILHCLKCLCLVWNINFDNYPFAQFWPSCYNLHSQAKTLLTLNWFDMTEKINYDVHNVWDRNSCPKLFMWFTTFMVNQEVYQGNFEYFVTNKFIFRQIKHSVLYKKRSHLLVNQWIFLWMFGKVLTLFWSKIM